MQVVSASDFRSNQGRYLSSLKRGQRMVLKSRYGNFNITPVEEENDLTSRICRGLNEVKLIQEGKLKGYTLEEALNEI